MLVLFAASPLFTAASNDAQPQIIVNSSVKLPVDFSNATLRSIFFGRMQTWPDGTPVKVFVLPDTHPLHRKFCMQYLKTFPYVLNRQWDQMTFTGTGTEPTEVATTYSLYEKVRSTPGSIGYVNRLPGNMNDIKLVGQDSAYDTERTIRF